MSDPPTDYKALARELARAAQMALRDTGCDGDLCMWAWHEQHRELLSRPEVKALLEDKC